MSLKNLQSRLTNRTKPKKTYAVAHSTPQQTFIASLELQKSAYKQIHNEGKTVALDPAGKKIPPRWWKNLEGGYTFVLKYGPYRVEIGDRHSVDFDELRELVTVCDELIEAVEDGELDEALDHVAQKVKNDRMAGAETQRKNAVKDAA